MENNFNIEFNIGFIDIFFVAILFFLIFLPKLKDKIGKGYSTYLLITGIISCVSIFHVSKSQDILSLWDLQWRNIAETSGIILMTISVLSFFVGLIILFFTVLKGKGITRVLTSLLNVFLIFCSLFMLWSGLLGASWFDEKETVIELQGNKYVKVEKNFLIHAEALYLYHGPFVMGNERIETATD